MARVTKDSIDLAEMRDTLRSAGYRLIHERQEEQYAQCVRELIIADTWDKVRYIQGQIVTIARGMQLPKIIETEIRAKQRKAGVEEEPD
jgi:hypothetical protein